MLFITFDHDQTIKLSPTSSFTLAVSWTLTFFDPLASILTAMSCFWTDDAALLTVSLLLRTMSDWLLENKIQCPASHAINWSTKIFN